MKVEVMPEGSHEFIVELAEHVFDELEERYGHNAFPLVIAVAAMLVGAYARAQKETIVDTAKAVGITAMLFDERVRAAERATGHA